MNSDFGESVSPVAAIQAILHDCPFSASILRELLQNSDDARATKQIFVLDMGKDPALIAYNDSQFQEEDWKAIQTIHKSSKREDTSKIGKYGVGFRACYHVTDKPQILSGSSFAILDPISSGGTKIDYDSFKNFSDHRKHFDFFPNLSASSSFPGTVIRLPLRSASSELSKRVVRVSELDQMIKDYITQELNISLLFLDNLRTIEIWKVQGTNKTCLARWTKSEKKTKRQSKESSLFFYDSVLSDGRADFSWRIIQTQNAADDARSHLAKKFGGDTVNHVFERHKLSPGVRIAHPLFTDENISGRLFTFLPLPSKTGFPVHIHALFALTSSRQGLRNQYDTGIVAGSDNDVLIKWNSLLFDYYIPQAWSHLLKTLAEDAACKDIISSWPPYSLSIMAGDGLYWQNILQATLNFAIKSGLAIWPKVSDTNTTRYVDLTPSLVVATGEVDPDVLIALSRVGLTLVQLPKTHMQFLDDSITKLTPHVARDQIRHRSLGFNDLSQDQKRKLCDYFLSDKDFSSIYGLPLFPTIDGPYVSLDKRGATNRRYIALATDEVDVFRTLAGDAISLDDSPSEVAALVREKGMTQANIDLLSPPSVVAYLLRELSPLSDQRLAKFWTWLEKWQQRDQVMALLKSNTVLHLVPTSKGPQLVSSPAFLAPCNQLFEKLGLAFVSSVLPSTVVQFLNNHGVVKDTNDMNHFLAAIKLAALRPLSDGEPKSVFDHISTYYRSLSSDNLVKLKKLPVFPVLNRNVQAPVKHDSSVKWQAIHGLNVKGISPMSLIPLTDDINFLDKSCFSDPSSSLIKALQIPILSDEDVLLLALSQFSSQPKPLQASFISYIRQNHRWTKNILSVLQETRFIRSSNGALQSPIDVIDPNSGLKSLFLVASRGRLIPIIEDNHDRQILDDLRNLEMIKACLSSDIVQERIAYISANRSSPDTLIIARSLVSLMNDPSFSCATSLSIDQSLHWLPTQTRLVSSRECIDYGRRDADLFDEVLCTLDETISITPSFRSLLGWDKPLPFNIITEQLNRVLGQPDSDAQYRKVSEIIRELSGRQVLDRDIKAIEEAAAERPWVPTKSGVLVPPSQAVFTGTFNASSFHEICFSKAQTPIYQFLLRMGCSERPSALAIIMELEALRKKVGTDDTIIQQAVQLLEMLPDMITTEERASLLVPTEGGDLVPISTGVYYYKGRINVDGGKIIAHYFISEKLAQKIGIPYLGTEEAEIVIDFGGNPTTLIRNILTQYEPNQFFTEFIANASDAGAKLFNILVDDHVGPTEHLVSESLAAFQNASLVVHNNGVFSARDFNGILHTGTGAKRGEMGKIGRFGLGALSMFHFTELAMIVSGDRVLFLSPSKRTSFGGKHSFFCPLQNMKILYADHLKTLDGLFGFDLSSTESYPGTLFRLPLRNKTDPSQYPVSTTPWTTTKVEGILLAEFDKVAYKSLLFTGLSRIEVFRRQNGPDIKTLRVIESNRVPHSSMGDKTFKWETVTFKPENLGLPKWLIVTTDVNIPDNFKAELKNKYDMHHLLPIRIAVTLESDHLKKKTEYNLFCTLPLPVVTPVLAHISAPLILEQERRNVRVNGAESEYNRWLLSSELPCSYLYLLEKILQIRGSNIPWLPGMHSNSVNSPSQIFMDGFWSSKILRKSSRRVFSSKYNPTSFLCPNDAVLFAQGASEYRKCQFTLPEVLSATRPPNLVELPGRLFSFAENKASLRIVDTAFLKPLLERVDPRSQWLKVDAIDALLHYLSPIPRSPMVSLDMLPLIPLEDGSCAKIEHRATTQTNYYVVEPEQVAAYNIFPPNRNVLPLDDAGISRLVEECIAPAHEWSKDKKQQAWIASFWNSGLKIFLENISHLPLIQTIQPSKFIPLNSMKDPSVTVVEAKKSTEGFEYVILQQLGMMIVVRGYLPRALREQEGKRRALYTSFLEHIQKNEAKGLNEILSLKSDDREALASWVRSKFPDTPPALANVARKLPVWFIRQRAKPLLLAALADASVLPASMPSDTLLPFTDHPVIDWEVRMQSVEKEGCSAKRVTKLLRTSQDTILYSQEDQVAYKQFIKCFLNFEKVKGYSLLVPNEEGVLSPAESLFERHELFLAAFKASPERLLHNNFQDIAESLAKYDLNRGCQLDLSMFIEWANAFVEDEDNGDRLDDGDKRRRSGVLYTYFNKLPLSPSDIDRCRKLDRLKFIPRGSANRKGYEKMNIKKYMRHDILSPGKISLSDYEAICWSQRGCVTHEPNSTLRGTYQNLGKPTGKEVVKHLRVLTELGKKYGRRPALLLDLKATYKWLNENVDEIFVHIRNENRKSIFLNVDNPDSDSWVWHSGSTLVKGLQDIGDLHGVKDFLRNYNNLLIAAGVRTIQKVTTEAVAAMDKTPLFRSQFRDMREQGFEVCVTFKARDHELQIPPAHKAWLSVNSKHFWRTFVASKAEPCVEVDASDYSSHCVKETIDWMYAGELPTFITSPSSNNGESKAKLDLALNILSLAHRWEITELHQRLQEFIVNLSDFINPYWVKHICKCAELAEAKELSRACNDFEAKNRDIMHQILSTEYNNV